MQTTQQEIASRFNAIDFANTYIEICTSFNNEEKALTINKKNIEKALQKLKFKADYIHSENCFSKNHTGTDFFASFVISFDEGLLEVYYGIHKLKDKEDYTFGRFDAYATLCNPEFESLSPLPVPLPTNDSELLKALSSILKLHKNAIKTI